MLPRKCSIGILAGLAALAGIAVQAHEPFQSFATVQLRPSRLEISLLLSPIAAEALLQPAPVPPLGEENFALHAPRLKARAADLLAVAADTGALPLQSASVYLTAENDVEFLLNFPRPPAGHVRFTLAYLKWMTDEHNATLTITDDVAGNLGWAELWPGHAVFESVLPSGPNTAPTAAPTAPAASTKSLFGSFLLLGVEHILTGYDHLLFLCGLLVVCRKLKTMVTIITCFTVAHSVTLALAALGLVVVSGRIVEPLIAASIVFVGVENLLRRGEPKARWLVTSAFGLIHGFGFAGALIEIGLGANGTPLLVPLFSFNLGVELGQLAVAAVFVPVLWRLRKWPPFARHGTSVASLFVALAGGYWLLQRTLFA
jgi:hydrogenase/urease accessory protein HupE